MRRGRALVIDAFLVVAACLLVPATTSSAAPPPPVASLPTSVELPPVGNGVPWNPDPLVRGDSLDVSAFGYVEEEFFVSGQANVYQYGPTGAVEIQTADVPYANRILVRRPENPRRFSGNVQVGMGGQSGDTLTWAADYVLANGDAWVWIQISSAAVQIMKSFDPVRYAPLNFPENGLTWDFFAQVGRLLKTQTPANPLNGYDVKHLYANGWSGSAAQLLLYISDGFHNRVRMPDGGPIFDGYLLGEPSGAGRLSSTAPPIPTSDPRQQVQPRDVPAITLHTRPQEPYRRRPDSDAPSDRYRVYEVAGARHFDVRVSRAYNQPEEAFEAGGPFGCVHEMSRFPFHFYFQSTLARLDAWAALSVTPPPSQRLELNPSGTVKLDEHGNPVGGVRSSYLDVPTARYLANTTAPGGSLLCGFAGAQERFSPEKLAALYRNHGGYVSEAIRRINELEGDGWLLPADAQELREEAAQFDGL